MDWITKEKLAFTELAQSMSSELLRAEEKRLTPIMDLMYAQGHPDASSMCHKIRIFREQIGRRILGEMQNK